MRSTTVRKFTVGLAAIATVAAGIVPPALAQSPKSVVSGLQENQDLIRQCRRVNQTIEVFDNTNLGPSANRLGTLSAGREVLLTGVVVSGRVQIFLENDFNGLSRIQPMGWINAGFLSRCGSGTCFQANVPLEVRSTPSFSGSRIGYFGVGEPFDASTTPPRREIPSDGSRLTWLEVITTDGRTGWVVETSSGQVNARTITCP